LVAREKILDCLPDHLYGASKARFFGAFGFRREVCEVLLDELCEHGCGPDRAPANCCLSLGGIMIKEHGCVVLTNDLPSAGLLSGDVGTVVHIHGNVSAYEIEFATLTGKTIAVAALLPTQCRPIGHRDINHVRVVRAI
jgi:hypothetical protein